MWSPFKYFAQERAKDREALLSALAALFEAQNRQAEVAIEQSRALRSFIDGYMTVTGAPSRRVSSDESEYQHEQLSWGVIGES